MRTREKLMVFVLAIFALAMVFGVFELLKEMWGFYRNKWEWEEQGTKQRRLSVIKKELKEMGYDVIPDRDELPDEEVEKLRQEWDNLRRDIAMIEMKRERRRIQEELEEYRRERFWRREKRKNDRFWRW